MRYSLLAADTLQIANIKSNTDHHIPYLSQILFALSTNEKETTTIRIMGPTGQDTKTGLLPPIMNPSLLRYIRSLTNQNPRT